MKRSNAIGIGFPGDFMFQLSRAEFDKLKEQAANSSQIAMSSGKHAALTSQIAISKRGRGGRRTRPYAFTEHGATAKLKSVKQFTLEYWTDDGWYVGVFERDARRDEPGANA